LIQVGFSCQPSRHRLIANIKTFKTSFKVP
jgi:hypothetical protein